MKIIFGIGFLTFFAFSSFSQMSAETEKLLKEQGVGNSNSDTLWKIGGLANVNFSQVYLSNWAGGGQNAISTQGILSLFANYNKEKTSWDNSIDLAYGVIKQGEAKSTPWFKNDDRLEVNSKFGHKASEKWYYSGLFNFRSQFNYGYSKVGDTVPISNFMAPAYTIVALGMDYKPSKSFTFFVAPLTTKLTFVMDEYLSGIGAFGVDTGNVFRSEIGGYVKLALVKEKPFKMEGVTFKTNLTLFSNYSNEPGNVDVTWETLTNVKLNKYMTISLSTYLIYDHDIDIARYNTDGSARYYQEANGDNVLGPEGSFIQVKGPVVQFKEAWSVGFAYKF
jgi:hypothetical protein